VWRCWRIFSIFEKVASPDRLRNEHDRVPAGVAARRRPLTFDLCIAAERSLGLDGSRRSCRNRGNNEREHVLTFRFSEAGISARQSQQWVKNAQRGRTGTQRDEWSV
jgi:hypothetical protein